MKMMKNLDGRAYEEQLKSLSLFSPEKKRPGGDLVTTCVSVTREEEGQAPICSLVTVTEPKGMAWKMHEGRVRVGQGKVLHQGVAEHIGTRSPGQ